MLSATATAAAVHVSVCVYLYLSDQGHTLLWAAQSVGPVGIA